MLSRSSLQNVLTGLKGTLAEMHRANDALSRKITEFESDKTRSKTYITENITAARAEILPKMRSQLDTMAERNAIAQAQLEFWESRALLFGQIPFNADAATDALIRARYANELAAMDPPLLYLTQRNALQDGNLALVWACARASRDSVKMLDLSGVDIPGQKEAIAIIQDCEAAVAEAELLLAGLSGQSVDPVRKLEIARRMQPNRPTAHNSPGRS